MNTINPLPPVQPAAPMGSVVLSREGRAQDLRPEQIIQASVVEAGQDKVLLDMGHQRIWAETRIPMQVGQKLNMLVVETSPRLVLQLMETPLSERITHLVHLLGGKWDLLPLLNSLTGRGALPPAGGESGQEAQLQASRLSLSAQQTLEAFKAVLSDPALVFDGAQFRQLLKHLGLQMEAQLAAGDIEDAVATLKNALLELSHELKGGGERASQVEGLLQMLELFQLCNLRLSQQGAVLWPLPLPFLENGYLMIEERHPEGPDQEESPWQLSLHLSLETLGELRVDFLHESQGLFLRFACSSQEKAEFFSRFGDELREQITSVPLRSLTFAGGVEPGARSLIKRVLGEGRGVLDTRV